MGVGVDSSIFIAAERGRFDWVGFHAEIGSERLYVTVMSLAELLHGAERADSPERKEKRMEFIGDVELRYPLLPFCRDEAVIYSKIWASMSAAGTLIGLHDLQIAAVALHHGYRVATLNVDEFSRVQGLEVMDASLFRIVRRAHP
jgi:predicted nucleic acid-binding protein